MNLIASYAIVNSLPLIYVPKCLNWVDQYKQFGDKGANKFLRECALYWNSDILDELTLLKLKQTDDVILFFGKTFKYPTFHSMFYLFDEHQEIFHNNIQNTTYFRSFTCWAGSTSSRISITIYCANSKLEYNLPGGAESKIIRIKPPTFEEFGALAQEFFDSKLDRNNLLKIEYATGRISMDLFYFSQRKHHINFEVESFISKRTSSYIGQLNNVFNQCSIIEKSLLLGIIHDLFNFTYHNKPYRGRHLIPEPFYDMGILLVSDSHEIYPINESASRALYNIYLRCENSVEHQNYIKRLWKGQPFENLLIKNEYKSGISNNKYMLTQHNTNTMMHENIQYNIKSIMPCFFTDEVSRLSFLSRNRWPTGISVLFVPKSLESPAFDYMIVSYFEKKVQIVFKKVTMSSVYSQHGKGDLHEFLNPTFHIEDFKKPVEGFFPGFMFMNRLLLLLKKISQLIVEESIIETEMN